MVQSKKYILFILFLALFFTGCSQNEDMPEDSSAKLLSFKLRVSGSSTRSEQNEDVNMMVYLYLFPSGNSDSDTAFDVIKCEIKNGEDAYIAYWPEADKVGTSCDLYAIGYNGDDSNITLGDAGVTRSTILGLTQGGIDDINSSQKKYMLSATKNINLNEDIQVDLERSVCRMDLEIEDSTVGKVFEAVSVTFQAPDETYVIGGNTSLPTATLVNHDMTLRDEAGNWEGSTYFFEKKPTAANMEETDKVQVTVTATRQDPDFPADLSKKKTFTYKFQLNANGGYVTNRNTIYKVKAALNLTELEIKTNTTINWSGSVDETQDVSPE